jgi:hypothetical protein
MHDRTEILVDSQLLVGLGDRGANNEMGTGSFEKSL